MMRIVSKCALMAALCMPVMAGAVTKETKASPTREELQQLYMDYLEDEGYKPTIDSDGDVNFKREGRQYFIRVSESDPEFFQLVFFNFWSLDDEAERARALAAADVANGKSKVAKVFTNRDNMWASIEMFVGAPEDFKAVFTRASGALDFGVANFVEEMRKGQ